MKTERDKFGNYHYDDDGPCPECGAEMRVYVQQFDSVGCSNRECPVIFCYKCKGASKLNKLTKEIEHEGCDRTVGIYG